MATLRGGGRIVALVVAGTCGLASAACEAEAEAPNEPAQQTAKSGDVGATTGASVGQADDETPPAIPAEPGVVVAKPSSLMDGVPFVQQQLDAPGDEYATHGSMAIKGSFRPALAVEMKTLRARLGGSK